MYRYFVVVIRNRNDLLFSKRFGFSSKMFHDIVSVSSFPDELLAKHVPIHAHAYPSIRN